MEVLLLSVRARIWYDLSRVRIKLSGLMCGPFARSISMRVRPVPTCSTLSFWRPEWYSYLNRVPSVVNELQDLMLLRFNASPYLLMCIVKGSLTCSNDNKSSFLSKLIYACRNVNYFAIFRTVGLSA